MKYNKKIINLICKKLKNGATHYSAALSSGISEETFYQWMKKPEFSESIKRAEADCQRKCEGIIQKAAIKSWTAAAWYLERRQSETYALKQRLEHSGIETAPIMISVTPAPQSLNDIGPSKSD